MALLSDLGIRLRHEGLPGLLALDVYHATVLVLDDGRKLAWVIRNRSLVGKTSAHILLNYGV